MKHPKKKDLPPCAQDVYDDGKVVAQYGNVKSADMEAWVIALRKRVGTKALLDWHYAGGRAVLKALGDLQEVASAIALFGIPRGATT